MGNKKSSGPQTAPLVQINNLTFALSDGRLILDDVSVALQRRRVGLIGKNGAGKTTLLKALMREGPALQLEAVSKGCTIGYLAQESYSPRGKSVAEVFGIAGVREALLRLESGDTDPSLYDILENSWDAPAHAERSLAMVGLPATFLERLDTSLSGGEWTRVRLASLLMKDPDLLLLDEPTNHLDREGRLALQGVLRQWSKGLLVASHDRELLEDVDEIWEIRQGKIHVYGGNFSFYRIQRENELEALRHDLASARLESRRAALQAQEAQERQAKRAVRGMKTAPKAGLPTIVLGMMKRRAEETSARISKTHESRAEAAQERLTKAKEQVEPEAAFIIDSRSAPLPPDKLVLEFEGLNVIHANASGPLWRRPLSGSLHGPSRVALKGANGAGKTALLRALMGMNSAVSGGKTRWGVTRRAYCDQALSMLHDQKSVIENFREWTPHLPESERRIRLGRSHFPGDAVGKCTRELSGGERMRLALVCLLAGETVPEMLLMDEPSNHLDLTSLDELERALKSFQGALIVVSHDERFLEAIGITKVWTLSKEGLLTD